MAYYNYSTKPTFVKDEPTIFIIVPQNQPTRTKTKVVRNSNVCYFEYPNPSKPYYGSKFEELNGFRKKLESVMLLYEAITLSEAFFSETKKYLFKRIKELSDLFDEEDEDGEISVGSLKSMLTFLFSINEFSKPVLTLNENGTFQISWKKDNNNLVILRFKEEESLDYVIFRSSKYEQKPIILNGKMNIFDFKDYFVKLDVYAQISKK